MLFSEHNTLFYYSARFPNLFGEKGLSVPSITCTGSEERILQPLSLANDYKTATVYPFHPTFGGERVEG